MSWFFVGRLIGSIKPDNMLGARGHAIVLPLLDTGTRASELCSLKLSNTSLKGGGYVKVLGKGSKERMVPFDGTTKKSLIRYIRGFRPESTHEDTDELFLSVDGTRLTYEGLAQIIRRLAKTAVIPGLHAHLCRHPFAVRYLVNGGDVMTLRLVLGQTSLEVTQIRKVCPSAGNPLPTPSKPPKVPGRVPSRLYITSELILHPCPE